MKILKVLAGLVMGATFLASAHAQERSTKAEVQAMVEEAAAMVAKLGVEKGAAEINTDPKWRAKGTALFLHDLKGNNLASSTNPKFVGKNTWEIKDPNGKPFIKEMTELAASKGSGWVDYEFSDPVEKKLVSRTAYVRKVAGFDGFVGAATLK